MEYLEVYVLVISFLFFLILGMPVAYSVGLSSLLTILVNIDSIAAFTTIAQRMATGLDSFALLAIPFFVLAGQIMNQGGIASRLIAFAKALVGSFQVVWPMSILLEPCYSEPSRDQRWPLCPPLVEHSGQEWKKKDMNDPIVQL